MPQLSAGLAPLLDFDWRATVVMRKSGLDWRQAMDAEHETSELLTRLEEQAANRGMTVAVDRVDGHWRAGFLSPYDVQESVFVLHASGPDRATAIRQLARLVTKQPS
jgi:hypothetical protein